MTKFILKELLDKHLLRPFDLCEVLQGKVSQDTVYKIAQNKTNGADLSTINQILWALNKELGIPATFNDLIEWDGLDGGNPRRNGRNRTPVK